MNNIKPENQKAYTIAEFCAAYRISRKELYRLWEQKVGPRSRRISPRKIIILIEDAEAWAHDNESAA